MSLIAYWLGNLTLDYFKYLAFGIGAPLIVWILDVKIFTDHGGMFFFWSICLMTGFAMIPFAYFNSFLFKKTSAAQMFLFLITFISGMIMPIILALIFMQSFDDYDGNLAKWGRRITFFARLLLPPFCFGDVLWKLTFR